MKFPTKKLRTDPAIALLRGARACSNTLANRKKKSATDTHTPEIITKTQNGFTSTLITDKFHVVYDTQKLSVVCTFQFRENVHIGSVGSTVFIDRCAQTEGLGLLWKVG